MRHEWEKLFKMSLVKQIKNTFNKKEEENMSYLKRDLFKGKKKESKSQDMNSSCKCVNIWYDTLPCL